MKNLFDYLDYYGNLSFYEYQFNEVDSLILSLLSYVKLNEIVPKDRNSSIILSKACQKFLQKYSEKDFKKEDWLFPSSYRLMKMLEHSKRFSRARLYHLSSSVDSNGQFGALTIRLPNDITYISYEGTDSAIVGWKEDFQMMYIKEISSQKLALEYFNNTINFFDREIYVGGHSKGGNLAMYAYMFGKDKFKRRVKQVYNFDGPGFLDEILESSKYQEMSSKLTMIVPKEAIIGILLGHQEYKVVNSSSSSILQHDAYNWECFGGYLSLTELSKKSQKLEKKLKEYLDSMNESEKKSFVETFFAIFENTNITSVMQLKELKISNLLSILKEFKNVPSSTKRNLVAILKMLVNDMN